ncbi:GDSL-type esterase/lipase family protein [Mastigocoleus testarum]|uniref:G-D-S-L family lipolytic protein n=1 Tax=Mastigocoleus testarum BC008 TaxID=371196 RepID=A0A0V7ZFQ6_9CYAN|nr:GDSL-type esterase/lipase family protein [Mastigocoleus testarum]KST63347.1 G-D-S-L family lipolytic protein [Mastigocoleus testarum BC008]
MKIILFISISINFLLVSVISLIIIRKGGIEFINSQLQKYQKSHNEIVHTPYYTHKKSQYEKLPKSELDIIFLGDSLTDEGEWIELLDNPHIRNRGISGDTTNRILDRLDNIVTGKPNQIFLTIGINDFINESRSSDYILEKYKEILSQIHTQTPKTKVIVQSVLPVNNQILGYWYSNQNIIGFNFKLEELAQEFNYQYINVFPKLSDSQNQLNARYTNDGLHLNGHAYLVWRDAVKEYLSTDPR